MTKKLIYVTLDLRRALWVPEISGAKIVCSYKSDLLGWMREQGADVWCFEEEFPEADVPRSSFMLLSRALTLNMLRDLDADLEFMVFKPSNKIKRWVEEQGWTLISPNIETCRQLEDKISFMELASKHDLRMPRSEEILWDSADLDKYRANFGEKFVVQGRMGHAGNCTYVFDENNTPDLTEGSRVKISKFVDGPTYTLNGYVSPEGKLVVGPIWQQIMHVKEWNSFEMGTVGVSPVELVPASINSLQNFLQQTVAIFSRTQYSGFFGLDLIWNEEKWYLIECNARFTATVSLQCLIDLDADISVFGSFAKKVELDGDTFSGACIVDGQNSGQMETTHSERPSFGQIIFRNSHKRPWKIPKLLKSGIYSLNEEGNWKLKSRAYDSRELEDGEILLLLSRLPKSIIDPGSDFASIQFRGSAFEEDGSLKDMFFDFYERMVLGFKIREKDLWSDRYARLTELVEPTFLYQKPLKDVERKITKKIKYQVEIFGDEVIRLLGEYNSFYLVEKVDGSRGWLPQTIEIDESASEDDFVLPNKESLDPESFLEKWQGKPYLLAGNSEKGIDCSAFVQRYFWEVRGKLLPKYSQDQKAACSLELNQSELKDDDLVFMRSKNFDVYHVGLVRNGKVWHSSLETGVVQEDLDALQDKYEVEGFRRL